MASVSKREWVSPNGEKKVAWVLRYTDPAGKRRLKTFERKKEAEEARIRIGGEMAQGAFSHAAERMTFGKAIDRFLEQMDRRVEAKDGLRAMTAYQWRRAIEKRIRPRFGDMKVSQVQASTVQLWMSEMALEGVGRSLVKKMKMLLSKIMDHAVLTGVAGRNPCREVDLRAGGQLPDRIDIPTKDEVRAALAAASPALAPALHLAVFTGMRMGEIRALRWTNVDLKRGVIHVVEAADQLGRIGPPKTRAGVRDVPIAGPLRDLLEHLAKRRRTSPYVIGSTTGKPKAPVTLQRRWIMLQIKLGWCPKPTNRPPGREATKAKYGFHSLRHVTASLLIEANLPAKVIQDIMGHGSMQMTFDTYGHLFDKSAQKAAAIRGLESSLAATSAQHELV